ncbi:PhzF family phenazine biosynthesis protein [Haloarcula nitratireducens]|uniref:PhzF family phenazine biosynthesis protein n=1 Tax=Haloarcula nitratireducens TaxID=2487749 RepID=A0AAW4P6C5_9EURY|nr:PhzF family phenazine biosynthesis protein [Halomicroarcula nitratireducens]MBX0293394.1 PhzF family phenazine biosynthesis protein [Halomicroarcula nitratireducens]
METRQVLLVDAFAAEPMTGNPAGVVPEAEGLTDDQLRAIANELGASETAFVLPSEEADRRLRYFTPEREVDLCGHATIAAHAALFERGALDAEQCTFETACGVLDAEVKSDGTVWMEQGDADIREVDLPLEDVADALGADVATLRDVGADLPLAVGDTGFPWLLVPINYFEHLSGLDPNMAAIEACCEAADAMGLYAFTFDTISGESTLHGRAFAPLAGIAEDPVTGTAAGACGAYVRRYGALDDTIEQVVVGQGHFLDRPGTVRVDTDGTETWVGGRAVTTLDGSLTIPAADEDDGIIEI